ncbi:hypothetical protein NL676_021495 [Syzygium grande]|nr:hypothetical protein NL676_021495 [Syzygium grande]
MLALDKVVDDRFRRCDPRPRLLDANARLRPTRGSVKKFSASPRGRRGSTSWFPIQRGRGRRRQWADKVEEHSGGGGVIAGRGDKFEAWKRRAEAIVEPREAQQDSRNEESRMWEDWLVDDGRQAKIGDDGNGELGIPGGVGAGFR